MLIARNHLATWCGLDAPTQSEIMNPKVKHRYIVGDKKIFVPVMLANVAYSWDGGADNVTIACMVGRESEPPGAKMGPLRLDLGPRSFAPLGQRPLTT